MKYWSIERDGPIMIARFANPPMGYFCAEAAGELSGLLLQWEDDPVRVIILTGANGQFITHYSVEELISFGADREEMERVGTALSDGYHELLRSISSLSKPVIAAITGDCMGGGLELAMWCDLRIVARGDYRLGLPEVRLGIMPGGSGTQRLARLLGEAKAREMILLGQTFPPEVAHAIGLVHRISDDALLEAKTIGRDLALLNPRALANIKQAMQPADAAGLKREAMAFLDTMRSAEAVRTMRAYVASAPEKRRAFLENTVG